MTKTYLIQQKGHKNVRWIIFSELFIKITISILIAEIK